MRRPYRDWNRTQIQAPVESTNQIQSGWKNQRHVIARVDFAALLKQCGDLFGSLVQLGTGEGFGNGTLGVQQGVKYMVGRRVGSPSEHTGNQLMLEDGNLENVLLGQGSSLMRVEVFCLSLSYSRFEQEDGRDFYAL